MSTSYGEALNLITEVKIFMKKALFVLIILVFGLLMADIFEEINDATYSETVEAVAGTNEFKTYSYNGSIFAALEDKEEIRFFILSTDYSEATGYQGTTTLGIILDKDLTVEKMQIIRSQDSPAYIRRINSYGFMRKFEAYKQGDEVEVVTGATMTSNAIIQSVNESIELFRPIIEIFMGDK